MRSQATPPAVAPATGTKPGDAHKTIKSMAASLFRAFDEGKLREQGPAPSGFLPYHLVTPCPLFFLPLPSLNSQNCSVYVC